MTAFATLVRCETKMVVRDTAGLLIPVGLPLLILLMSASPASGEVVAAGRSALDVFVLPLVFAMVIAMVGIINMPSFLTTYRKSGILRRLAVTPLSPAMVLGAQVVVSLAMAAAGIAVATLVAVVVFDARPPVNLVPALGIIALATLAMYSLGMVIASLAPTPNAGIALGMVTFFALGALGGMFGGTDALPGWLADVGEVLPFGATVDALGHAWVGDPVGMANILSLAGCALIGIVVSAATFRWDR